MSLAADRQITFVLGMHRSGTSALTSLLVNAGLDAGLHLLEPSFDNPKGFFENKKIIKFNDNLLRLLEMQWDSPLMIPANWSEQLDIDLLKVQLEEIFEAEFDENSKIVIKDPRICLLFPIWKVLLPELKFKCIIITRSPADIAKSLYARNKMSQDKANIIWLNHYHNAEYHTRGLERRFIEFKDLLQSPKKVCQRLNKFLGYKDLSFSDKALGTIDNNHSSIVSTNAILIDNKLSDLASNSYELLQCAKANLAARCIKSLDSIRNEYFELHGLFVESVYRKKTKLFTLIYVDEQGNRNKVLENLSIGNNLFELTLKASSPIRSVILLPSNDKAYLKLESVQIQSGNDELPSTKLREDYLYVHGNEYVVNSRSYFQYGINASSNEMTLKVQIQLFAVGVNAIDELSLLHDKVSEWISKNVYQLSENNKNLETQLIKKQSDIDELKLEHLHITRLFENKLKETEQLITSLENEKKQKVDYENQILGAQQELELAKNKIQEIERANIDLIDKYKDTMKQLKSEIAKNSVNLSFKEEYESLRLANRNIQDQFQKKTLDLELFKLKFAHQEEKNSIELELLKKQLLEQIALVKEFKKELDELQKIEKENLLLQFELKSLKENSTHSVEEINQLKEENNNLRQSLELQKKELNSGIEVNNQLLLEQFEIQKSSRGVDQFSDAFLHDVFNYLEDANIQADLNEELEEANQKYFLLKDDLEKIKSESSSDIADKQKLIEALQDQINQAAHLISRKEDEIGNLNETVNHQRKELLKHKVDIRNMSRDMVDLKESVSFKVGAGLTSPARWVYDKASGREPVNKSRLWLIKNLIAGGIKNPIAAVMKLSPKNLRTLHQAMKSESNETIIANFNNLVKAPLTKQEKLETQVVSLPIDESLSIAQNENIDLGSISEQKAAPQIETKESFIVDTIAPEESERVKVMYISPNLPDYDTSSGGKRATRMIELLCEQFDVYVFTYGARPQKYIDKLTDIGAIVIQGNDYLQIKKRIPKINTLIFAWYYSYNDANKLVQLYNDAKIIVDSVDVHWVREERSIGLVEGLSGEKVASNKRAELEVYRKADIVWTVTENDKNYVLEEIPEMQVDVVSNIHDNHIHAYEDSGTNKMLFFGGFNHYPNISAAKNIVENILPLVREEIPDAELILAGANAPDDIEELGTHEGVDYRGFIEEEDLDHLYKESFLSVAPLLAGAGIKGKICESIVYRTPVATNAIGNEGIHLISEEEGLIAEDNAELANLIVKAMKREFDMNAFTHLAQEKLKHIVGTETVKKRMYASIMPEVSICIVTWNRLDLLKRCIESIEGNTEYPFYKILVHSNGCEDGTQEYLEAASKINTKIVPILSKENEVFVIPNNNMMKMFPENDAVLVNNDVYVTKGWLTELYKAAYGNANIGIAGSKILYPDNSLQEFGSELYENGSGRNIGKHDDPNKDEYKQLQRVGYVSGCSMYIKKKTIDRLGVFDLQFHPCYCEDSDYCYTAWEHDIETVVTPKSIIYHDEGGTSGTDEDSGFKAYQKVNFEKFLTKHKQNLGHISDKIKGLN